MLLQRLTKRKLKFTSMYFYWICIFTGFKNELLYFCSVSGLMRLLPDVKVVAFTYAKISAIWCYTAVSCSSLWEANWKKDSGCSHIVPVHLLTCYRTVKQKSEELGFCYILKQRRASVAVACSSCSHMNHKCGTRRGSCLSQTASYSPSPQFRSSKLWHYSNG
jgi:hypothetical protein